MAHQSPEGPIREEEALGKAYDARLMGRLLSYLQGYRIQVAAAVLMLVAASGLELVGPWLTKIALDRAVPTANTELLGTLAAIYIASLAAAAALEYARTLLTTWIGQHVMLDLRGQVFSHLQRLELAFFDRNPVGRLMTRVTSDIEVLNEMFTSGVVTIFGDIFTIGAIVTAMLLLDWRLALVSFAVLPFGPDLPGSMRFCRKGLPESGSSSCSARRSPRPGGSRVSTRVTSRRTCAPSPTTRCSSRSSSF